MMPPAPRTFAALVAEQDALPKTFAPLWKKLMNSTPLAQTAPLVGTPKTANSDLIRQATKDLLKGQNRASVMSRLQTSTARKPATAVAAPAPAPAASAPSSPSGSSGSSGASGTSASASSNTGFGGAGYSGANAAQLGHASNPGWVQAAPAQQNQPVQ